MASDSPIYWRSIKPWLYYRNNLHAWYLIYAKHRYQSICKKNYLVNNFNNSGHYISKKAMHITSWPQKHLTSLPEKSPCACIVLPHLGTCKSSWVRRNWICWICDDLRSRLKQTWLEKPQICCHSFTIDSCVGIVTRAQNFSNKKRIPIQKSIALDCEDIANNALSLD